MRMKSLLVAALLMSMAGLLPLFPSPASASSTSPTISGFSPANGPVGATVTISGTNLADATSVTFGQTPATVVLDKSTKVEVQVPSGATTNAITVETPGGSATSSSEFVVTTSLDGVVSLASNRRTHCALLSSGAVDCWGFGDDGELGDGVFGNSSIGAPVVGIGGTGTLGGVVKLTSNTYTFCALLTSGRVDCWGRDDLGDGSFGQSAVPVAVLGVGGSGTLGNVVSLVSDRDGTAFCALLASGRVDCWGGGPELGDGSFEGGAVPVEVVGVGGSGILRNVASLAGSNSYSSFCALLISGGVDCWGYGNEGQLGDGVYYTVDQGDASSVPVAVVGVGGSGTLVGAVSLTANQVGYCALLSSGGVDCWGQGTNGQLGDGLFYRTGPYGSDVPVAVLGVGGTGTLGSVVRLTSNRSGTYCALLTSNGVDCWGDGYAGQLGDGLFYRAAPNGSAVPVAVLGVGGRGTLGGVVSLTGSDGGPSFCGLVTSGGVDCWGFGKEGELGDGIHYKTGNLGSAVPEAVVGVGGSGTLGGLESLDGDAQGFCSLLTLGAVDCWGAGYRGQIGDGIFKGTAVPVAVVTASIG
jgi:alpha-tubulin suppressor-like RCC1 family protein